MLGPECDFTLESQEELHLQGYCSAGLIDWGVRAGICSDWSGPVSYPLLNISNATQQYTYFKTDLLAGILQWKVSKIKTSSVGFT